MSNEIHVTIRGNAGAAPIVYKGKSPVVRFNVAVSASRYNPEQSKYVDSEPQWFTVKAFNSLGQNVAESVDRGTPVIVRGELVTEYWRDSDGEDHSRQVIRAESVGIELHGGIARYRKVIRNAQIADATDYRPAAPKDVSGLPPVDVSGLPPVDVSGLPPVEYENAEADAPDPAPEDELVPVADGSPF
ncbi:MAG TPA: single-stranded DNA-binding protein [Actinomycetaceae bacterium]|nr:single-stranded DNA-binding protein [Actinomycetaceae bacterium]